MPWFTVCGSMMRLWVFDRPGPYNSEKLIFTKSQSDMSRSLPTNAIIFDAGSDI